MNKVSMSHLISFSRYQTKCVIKFLFRQLRRLQSLNVRVGLSSERETATARYVGVNKFI